MTIQWLGTPVDKSRVRAAPRLPHLGDFDLYGMLGQPPNTCPTPVSADAQAAYKKCRDTAYALAVSQCASYPGNKADCITPNFYDNFNKSDCFNHCAEKCTAAGPIKAAQEKLNRPVTGVWNAGDQAAMQTAGPNGGALTFQDLAPGCKGSAPVPAAGPAPKPPPAPTAAASETPWGLIALAAAAAGAIYLGMS